MGRKRVCLGLFVSASIRTSTRVGSGAPAGLHGGQNTRLLAKAYEHQASVEGLCSPVPRGLHTARVPRAERWDTVETVGSVTITLECCHEPRALAV